MKKEDEIKLQLIGGGVITYILAVLALKYLFFPKIFCPLFGWMFQECSMDGYWYIVIAVLMLIALPSAYNKFLQDEANKTIIKKHEGKKSEIEEKQETPKKNLEFECDECKGKLELDYDEREEYRQQGYVHIICPLCNERITIESKSHKREKKLKKHKK